MSTEKLLFWVVTFTGSVVAGYWLAVRPGSTYRNIATPVSALVILMAVLLCLLALSGQDLRSFSHDVLGLTFG